MLDASVMSATCNKIDFSDFRRRFAVEYDDPKSAMSAAKATQPGKIEL
jgi:hypothetical protein